MIKRSNEITSVRLRSFGRGGLAAFLMSTACALLMANGASAATLQEAVQAAVDTNPDIGVLAKDRKAIEQELRQGWALYFPSIDARWEIGPQWNKDFAAGIPGSAERMTRHAESVTLTQRLFDGFEAASEVERQKSRVDSAALRVMATSQSIGLDAVQAYLDTLRQQELLALAEDNQKTHERYLADMKQRLAGGTGSMADVRQAESRLARAMANVEDTRGRLEDSITAYVKVVGETPEGLIKPAGVDERLPASLDMAVAMAVESSPDVARANQDIKTAQAELRQSRVDYFPKVNIEASTNWSRDLDGVRGDGHDYRAVLVTNWNIFRGGETAAKNEEFVHRLAEAREALRQSERLAEEEARRSWTALWTARNRAEAIGVQVKANEKVRDAYIQQFNLGQRSLLDVLDSENELFISRGDLITAQYVALFAGYRMLAVQGALLSALGVTPPKEGMTRGMMASLDAEEEAAMAAAEAKAAASEDAAAEEAAPAEEAPAAAGVPAEEGVPAAEATPVEETPTAETAPAEAAPGETAPADVAPAAGEAPAEPSAEAPAQAAQAPGDGFKQAATGEASEEEVMNLNFNPMWSVQ